MKFNVGDLLITKDYLHNNKSVPAYVVEIHPIQVEEGWRNWWSQSITYKLFNGNTWRENINVIEDRLKDSMKRDRWYHHPVKE